MSRARPPRKKQQHLSSEDVYLPHPPSDDVSHISMDYTQHSTQPPDTPYERWRALCITPDLSSYEFVDMHRSIEDVDSVIESETEVERNPEEWKLLYIDCLKALKQSDILHNQRYYDMVRSMDFTGATSSESGVPETRHHSGVPETRHHSGGGSSQSKHSQHPDSGVSPASERSGGLSQWFSPN